jgi:hypothetical protein
MKHWAICIKNRGTKLVVTHFFEDKDRVTDENTRIFPNIGMAYWPSEGSMEDLRIGFELLKKAMLKDAYEGIEKLRNRSYQISQLTLED